MAYGDYNWGGGNNWGGLKSPPAVPNVKLPWNPATQQWQPLYKWYEDKYGGKGGTAPKVKMQNVKQLGRGLVQGIAANPDTMTNDALMSQLGLAKQQTEQGIQRSGDQMAQKAAQLGTTYSGVEADKQRQVVDDATRQLAEKQTRLMQEASERNRDREIQSAKLALNQQMGEAQAAAAAAGESTQVQGGGGMYG
jgi:hypothetical protein